MHNKLRFYERNYNANGKPVSPSPWTFDHRDNYFHSTNNTPGFTEIPYTYSTKKCFIQIEEDEVVYRFFNEETQQYETDITVTPQDSDYYEFYKYENGYMVPIENYFSWSESNKNYELFVYDSSLNFPSEPPVTGNYTSYFFVPNDGIWAWDTGTKKYTVVQSGKKGTNTEGQEKNDFDKYNNIYFCNTVDERPSGKNKTKRTEYAYVEEATVQTTDYSIAFYSSTPENTDAIYGLPCNKDGTIKSGKTKKFQINEEDLVPLLVVALPSEKLAVTQVYKTRGSYFYCSGGTWYKLYSGGITQEVEFKAVSSLSSSDPKNKYYYYNGAMHYYTSVDNTGIYKKESGKESWTLVSGDEISTLSNILFRYTLTPVESYLAAPAQQNDKWYVKICRAIYKAATSLWNTLRKIGATIKNFFTTLWSWLKGETYYGTEIHFHWGDVTEWDSIQTLKYNGEYYIASEKAVYGIVQDDSGKKVWTIAANSNAIGQVSFQSNIIVPQSKETYWYVQKDQKCYCASNEGIKEVPTISYRPNLNLTEDEIYYSKETKKCYILNSNLYMKEAPEYTDFTELYEKADAIRLVLNYDDDVYSTAFKNFNKMIQVLNEELGYNFPTNTNTVQPTGDSPGDWGFYFYDKYQGWITGKEANSLGII